LSPTVKKNEFPAQCKVVKEFDKDFHKMQLGRGGKCVACKGGRRTTNLKSQQPLIGMVFINADPKYAGRLDNKRFRGAIVFNAELADESTIRKLHVY